MDVEVLEEVTVSDEEVIVCMLKAIIDCINEVALLDPADDKTAELRQRILVCQIVFLMRRGVIVPTYQAGLYA